MKFIWVSCNITCDGRTYLSESFERPDLEFVWYDWLTDWLTGWLADWLAGWLTGRRYLHLALVNCGQTLRCTLGWTLDTCLRYRNLECLPSPLPRPAGTGGQVVKRVGRSTTLTFVITTSRFGRPLVFRSSEFGKRPTRNAD